MPSVDNGGREPLEAVRVVHALPGRLRLRLDGADPARLDSWADRFRSLPGVTAVTVNPVTLSILVLYDTTASSADPAAELDLRPAVAAENAEDAPIWRAPSSTTARAVARRFWHMDHKLFQATDGRFDLKLAIPAVLFGAAAWELLTGVEVAAATYHTLAWYSYNLFYQLHPREMQKEEPPPATPEP